MKNLKNTFHFRFYCLILNVRENLVIVLIDGTHILTKLSHRCMYKTKERSQVWERIKGLGVVFRKWSRHFFLLTLNLKCCLIKYFIETIMKYFNFTTNFLSNWTVKILFITLIHKYVYVSWSQHYNKRLKNSLQTFWENMNFKFVSWQYLRKI